MLCHRAEVARREAEEEGVGKGKESVEMGKGGEKGGWIMNHIHACTS